MKIKFDKLIEQNIAPKGAKMIGVYDSNGERMCGIPLGKLTPRRDNPLYSFGLISDTHIQCNSNVAELFSSKLDNALTFFEEQGASFVCHAGDVTNRGFIDGNGVFASDQFAEHKRICDLHNIPVYVVAGNHDSYTHGGKYEDIAPITNYIAELEQFTGNGLYYSKEEQGDLFIFIGQPKMTLPMNSEEITWFESLLSENKGKRCFVFVHPFLKDDSGNPKDAYESYLFETTAAEFVGIKQRFLNALIGHGNCYLFHGHSHFAPACQIEDKSTNYTNKNGFHSIHVPSLSSPANINEGGERVGNTASSFGYLVDVYEDCIVLRARDFGIYIGNSMPEFPTWHAIATYKI